MGSKRKTLLLATATVTTASLLFGITQANAEGGLALKYVDPVKPITERTTGSIPVVPTTIKKTTSTTIKPSSSDPLQGASFYGPNNPGAISTAAQWKTSRPADATNMQYIANNPTADWIGDWSGDPRTAVNNEVTAAAAAGKVAIVVAYNIPNRDCGQYSTGGAANETAYKTWIDGFAAGIGSRKTVVILEPDALAQLCDTTGERYRMLNYAVASLAKQTGALTYIDAGNASWLSASEAASRLQQAGVANARGFSINVSNFIDTSTNETYGDQIAKSVNKHYVIDTSRNGQSSPANNEWCNPDGRGLGKPATTATTSELADAYLWIKVAGESDGDCNGAPAAGTFMPDYALGLAQRRI
jgi:endoglucanase